MHHNRRGERSFDSGPAPRHSLWKPTQPAAAGAKGAWTRGAGEGDVSPGAPPSKIHTAAPHAAEKYIALPARDGQEAPRTSQGRRPGQRETATTLPLPRSAAAAAAQAPRRRAVRRGATRQATAATTATVQAAAPCRRRRAPPVSDGAGYAAYAAQHRRAPVCGGWGVEWGRRYREDEARYPHHRRDQRHRDPNLNPPASASGPSKHAHPHPPTAHSHTDGH